MLVFALAQTPEAEVHGEFLERVRQRLTAGRAAAGRPRAGDLWGARRVRERARERCATWERLLRDLDLGAVDLDDSPPTAGAATADGWLDRARQATWTRPAHDDRHAQPDLAHQRGKTTLARTLLRRDIGEVLDQPHVTTVSEAHPLVETDDARLAPLGHAGLRRLGAAAARACAARATRSAGSCTRCGTAWRTAPLWCSQEAVRNVRDEADVVLYLVNAAEDPEAAGYVPPEMELLGVDGPARSSCC